MLYILILSLLAPLESVSWSELKTVITLESVDPDTTEVVELEPAETEVVDEED